MLSGISDSVMKKLVHKMDKYTSKEEMMIAQVLAPNFDHKLLYITNRAYLEARVWPLSLLSLGLIAPKEFYAEVITIPPFCPNVINDEFEAGNYLALNGYFTLR